MLWSSNTPFSYESLPPASSDHLRPSDYDPQEHRIRLLRLSWASFVGKTPRCKLKTTTIRIGNPVPLDCLALSYVHGRDDLDRHVQVNGRNFRVSRNLYDCLEVLSKDAKRWGELWVDQICINNADVAERSKQVKSMGEVYRQAKGVIVWLGKGLHSDLTAVDVINSIFEREQESGEKEELNKDTKDLLESFIGNPYFKRLWAVQELVLARNRLLLIGDRELQWDTLIAVYSKHVFNPHPSSLRDITEDCTSLQRISMARTQRSILDIFDVINGFSKYECTDPRDHLFGLLGLLEIRDEGKKASFTVDYSLSSEAVFLNFCYEMLENMLETDQLFDIMVTLAHAMGFEGVFYGGCGEEEVFNFFKGAGGREGPSAVKPTVRNKLQAKTVQFQEAAVFLAMGVPAEYDMLSGKRIF